MCGIPDINLRTPRENPEMTCPGDTEEVFLLQLSTQTHYDMSRRHLGHVTTPSVLTEKSWSPAGDVMVSMTVQEEKTRSIAMRSTYGDIFPCFKSILLHIYGLSPTN